MSPKCQKRKLIPVEKIGAKWAIVASAHSSRFPFIAMAVGKLPVWSCLIDGEAIVCDENGLAVFDLIRRHGALASAVHCAFDLLELDGLDLRRDPIEMRKELLAERLRGSNLSIVP